MVSVWSESSGAFSHCGRYSLSAWTEPSISSCGKVGSCFPNSGTGAIPLGRNPEFWLPPAADWEGKGSLVWRSEWLHGTLLDRANFPLSSSMRSMPSGCFLFRRGSLYLRLDARVIFLALIGRMAVTAFTAAWACRFPSGTSENMYPRLRIADIFSSTAGSWNRSWIFKNPVYAFWNSSSAILESAFMPVPDSYILASS